jgi:Zn-dependent M28 family amino/carboxypeptidase
MVAKQGDPPAEYLLPLGWVRFPININLDSVNVNNQSSSSGLMTTSTSSLSNVLTTWHVAYHGLEVPNVRSVMGGYSYT